MVSHSVILDFDFPILSLFLRSFLKFPLGFSLLLPVPLQRPDIPRIHKSGARCQTFHGDRVDQIFHGQFILTLPFDFDSLFVLIHNIFVLV